MKTMNQTQIELSQLENESQENLSLTEGVECVTLSPDSGTVTAVIPYEPRLPDLKRSHAQFFVEQIKKSREVALSELRCLSGVPTVIKSLNRETLYRAVIPEGGLLQKGKDGLWRGVQYGKKGVSKHAKFVEIKPSVMEVFKTAGSQVMLVSISMQLNRIQELIEEIFGAFHRDRIAEILSGVDQFEMAILMQNPENRCRALLHSIQTLHTGLNKTIAELDHRIAQAPQAINSILYHLAPWRNKVSTATKAMGLAAESFRASLIGIGTLAECYAGLGERRVGVQALCSYFDMVMACDISSAAEKAMLLDPRKTQWLPQRPWANFLEQQPNVLKKLHAFNAHVAPGKGNVIEVEFMPEELKGRRKWISVPNARSRS